METIGQTVFITLLAALALVCFFHAAQCYGEIREEGRIERDPAAGVKRGEHAAWLDKTKEPKT